MLWNIHWDLFLNEFTIPPGTKCSKLFSTWYENIWNVFSLSILYYNHRNLEGKTYVSSRNMRSHGWVKLFKHVKLVNINGQTSYPSATVNSDNNSYSCHNRRESWDETFTSTLINITWTLMTVICMHWEETTWNIADMKGSIGLDYRERHRSW